MEKKKSWRKRSDPIMFGVFYWVLFLGLGSLRKESGRIRTRWMFKKGEEQWDGKSRKMEKEKKMKEE